MNRFPHSIFRIVVLYACFHDRDRVDVRDLEHERARPSRQRQQHVVHSCSRLPEVSHTQGLKRLASLGKQAWRLCRVRLQASTTFAPVLSSEFPRFEFILQVLGVLQLLSSECLLTTGRCSHPVPFLNDGGVTSGILGLQKGMSNQQHVDFRSERLDRRFIEPCDDRFVGSESVSHTLGKRGHRPRGMNT